MKANILDKDGNKTKTIELPECFSKNIREDIVSKILEVKKRKQPYSPAPEAGKRHSASGVIVRRRHVWKSGYGRGTSRVPRKALSRRGSQFHWVAAEISSVRGGRRAHPPKIASMINEKKINKKEMNLALESVLSASADSKKINKRYERMKEIKIENLPIIIESKVIELKTKEFVGSIKKILKNDLSEIAFKEKSVRSGRGKMRGRKYKKSAGALLVVGKEEKIKSNILDTITTQRLEISELAKGGVGRLVIYTEQAIKEIGEKFKL